MIINKRKIVASIIIALMPTLIGCNKVNDSQNNKSINQTSLDAVDKGKTLFKEGKYKDALSSFNMGISEDNSNKEALNLYTLTSDIIDLKEALENYDIDSANTIIEKLKENEEIDFIEEDFSEYKKTLKTLKKQYSDFDSKVATVENTYSSGDYTTAKDEAEKLLNEVKGFSFLEKRLENILNKIENNN